MINLNHINYNPDILTCLANLSNDEVFTPPWLVNQMLDMLPSELWSKKDAKFLDPCTKSGVFLREIAKRLNEGLKDEIPELQERLNHIFQNQIFGIAITELTSLLARRSVYCSKYANGEYSIADFDNESGNIYFKPAKHSWDKNNKCTCGASKEQYETENSLESHAYNFIHSDNLNEIKNMKFDVIIGNPPYQLETSGFGRQAKPIYHLFIEEAKKLQPKYLIMIIPARWFAGGFGLDDFRETMLKDQRIKQIVDFPNTYECFPGVDVTGGICYFLWDIDYKGECEITSIENGIKSISTRSLNEFSVFIRNSKSITILRKISVILDNHQKSLAEVVSPQKPFGLPTNYIPQNEGVPCWFIQKIGLKYAKLEDISDSNNYLNKWKLLLPKSPIAGQTDFTKPVGFYYEGNTRIAKPGECCTESWIVACAFDSLEEVQSFKSYLFTKIVRFLLLQTVVSQDVLRGKFIFIPDLGNYNKLYTDELLRDMWKIDDDEWSFIDSKIKSIANVDNGDINE